MLSKSQIYNCDCLVGLNRVPDRSIDMILTAPPYTFDLSGYLRGGDDLIAKELVRVLKEGGVMVWVVGDVTNDHSESLSSFKQAIRFVDECGLKLYDTMLFHKINPLPQNNRRYEQCFEYMFVFSKGVPSTFNGIKVKTENGGKEYDWYRERTDDLRISKRDTKDVRQCKEEKLHSNIFSYTIGGESTGHPAPFPIELALDQIKTWTNEGDTVLDPFIGSGTTALAAHILRREWIGMEINKTYCDIANKRLEPYLRQLKLF